MYNSSHKSAIGQASFGVILLLVLSVWANLSTCNHGCSITQSSELESLIATTFNNQTEPNNITIRLIKYTFVCIAQGAEQDTWRFVSLVANFTNNGTNLISQFQFECVESNWTATVNGLTQYTRTDPPDASVNTSLRRDCALCIDPRQAPLANNSHHCLGEFYIFIIHPHGICDNVHTGNLSTVSSWVPIIKVQSCLIADMEAEFMGADD